MSGGEMAVRVSTMDADLEFKLDAKATGGHLFELVCRTLGLRESWYFGLQYKNGKGMLLWLRQSERVSKQGIVGSEGDKSAYLWFVVRLYPETVQSELIQPITRHLFYLQVRQSILNGHVYCPAETCVLLATYAVQADLGDYNADALLDCRQLLPATVLDAHQLSEGQWDEKIASWWGHNAGLDKDECVAEYLKIAQDLLMYGVHYFDVQTSRSSTHVWLGVSAHGVGIYGREDRLVPTAKHKWADIRNMAFKNKKFTWKTGADETIKVVTHDMAISQVMLDLCLASHSLYLRRRQPDTLEVQQMRLQAKTDAHAKMVERDRLLVERAHRERVERELSALRRQMEAEHEHLVVTEQSLQRTTAVAELLAQKARVSEEESMVLAKRAQEAESEMHRVRLNAIASEEDKMHARMMDDQHARSSSIYTMTPYAANMEFPADELCPADPETEAGGGLSALTQQMERERQDYMFKSQHIQEQLSELRLEIDGLKRDEPPAEMAHKALPSTKERAKLFDN